MPITARPSSGSAVGTTSGASGRLPPKKPVSLSALMNAKQSTTVAITLLTWLAESGTLLADASQEDLDRWLATGPSTNGRVDAFLY
jgi:hypothetical protein